MEEHQRVVCQGKGQCTCGAILEWVIAVIMITLLINLGGWVFSDWPAPDKKLYLQVQWVYHSLQDRYSTVDPVKQYSDGSQIECDSIVRDTVHGYPENWLSETPYKNGKPSGLVKGFRLDGSLYRTTPYEAGVVHGVARVFYPSGGLFIEERYVKGEMDGKRSTYYLSGMLMSEGFWEKGKPVGIHTSYLANGKIVAEAMYSNGELLWSE